MTTWIVTAVLYGVGFGLFGLLGGVGAAGDALRQWGEASGRPCDSACSSS
jgi:hypothetical protein